MEGSRLLLILISLCAKLLGSNDLKGYWTPKVNAPEIYFINMDLSVDRRFHMENALKSTRLRIFRIRGNPWGEIYIPKDVKQLWTTAWCYEQTEEVIPQRSDILSNSSSPLFNSTSVMAGLCGRGPDKFGKEKNTIKELGNTPTPWRASNTSHFQAFLSRRLYYFSSNGDASSHLFQDCDQPFCTDHRR